MSNHFVEESSIIIGAADLAITDALLSSIAEEMGEALGRTAYSPNIKERRDFSCGVFVITIIIVVI